MNTITKTFGSVTITKIDEDTKKTVTFITPDVVVNMVKDQANDTWTCLYLRTADQSIMAEFTGNGAKDFEFLVIRWENDAFVGVVNSDMIADDTLLERVQPAAVISLQDGALLLQNQTRVILDMSKLAEQHSTPAAPVATLQQDIAKVAQQLIDAGQAASKNPLLIVEDVIDAVTDQLREYLTAQLDKSQTVQPVVKRGVLGSLMYNITDSSRGFLRDSHVA